MSTSIGQQLRQARERGDLTIEQAASATRIRPHYLKALEAGNFDALSSAAQRRGFVRAYAEYLGLDAELLLSELEGKAAPEPAASPAPPAEKPSAPPGEEPEPTRQFFAEVGTRLQRQRELLGLSLEDVERHTHLRLHYLQALESGDLDALPSPVQGRGMLNNYATFLGLNPEPLLLLFAEGLQARLEVKRAAQAESRPSAPPLKTAPPTRARRILSGDILVGGLLALSLVIFVFWGVIRIFNSSSEGNPTATAPSIVEVLLATSTPSQTPTTLPPSPTAPSALQLFPTFPVVTVTLEGGTPAPETPGVQVYLTIRQRAWLRVTVDGEVELEGRVVPGSAYPFIGDSQVEVLTGNAAGVQVFFNGQDLGILGEFGQVAHQIYTQQGVLAPTPTVTPTSAPTTPAALLPTATVAPAPAIGTAPPAP